MQAWSFRLERQLDESNMDLYRTFPQQTELSYDAMDKFASIVGLAFIRHLGYGVLQSLSSPITFQRQPFHF